MDPKCRGFHRHAGELGGARRKGCSISGETFTFPLTAVREREQSRRMKTVADAGDINPGASVGAALLSRGGESSVLAQI
jgi:hypothetical protein